MLVKQNRKATLYGENGDRN